MIRLGLTGGIAAGKSTVSKHLAERGIPVIDYDLLARKAVEPGSPALDRIVEAFGPQALGSDGSLDRAWMATKVFAGSDRESNRRRLEGIIHPAVFALAADEDARYQESGCPLVVHDIPLLVEQEEQTRRHGLVFDHIMSVEAPEKTRISRMVAQRGMSEGAAQARISAQADETGRRALADVIIDSSQPLPDMLGAVDVAVDRLLSLCS